MTRYRKQHWKVFDLFKSKRQCSKLLVSLCQKFNERQKQCTIANSVGGRRWLNVLSPSSICISDWVSVADDFWSYLINQPLGSSTNTLKITIAFIGQETDENKGLMEGVWGDFLQFLVNITSKSKYLFNLPRVRGWESMEDVTPNLRNEVKRAAMKPTAKSNC